MVELSLSFTEDGGEALDQRKLSDFTAGRSWQVKAGREATVRFGRERGPGVRQLTTEH
jgi:hypothetical protein